MTIAAHVFTSILPILLLLYFALLHLILFRVSRRLWISNRSGPTTDQTSVAARSVAHPIPTPAPAPAPTPTPTTAPAAAPAAAATAAAPASAPTTAPTAPAPAATPAPAPATGDDDTQPVDTPEQT